MNLWLAPFLQVKVSVYSQLCRWQFLLELWNWLFIEIMQVTTSIAIIQVLRLHCNYAGGSFYYSYVGGYFCCNHAGDCFCCSHSVITFCSSHVSGRQSLHRLYERQFLLYLCRWEFLLQLCRCYFLQCTTVSIVK